MSVEFGAVRHQALVSRRPWLARMGSLAASPLVLMTYEDCSRSAASNEEDYEGDLNMGIKDQQSRYFIQS